MKIIKSTNGFPYGWKAGRVEHLIRDILERKAIQQLDVERVMIVNPTWMHDDNIRQEIQTADPDFIICHNFADPAIPRIFDEIKQTGVPYIILGNSAHFRLDFWAMVCDLYFQNYEPADLELLPTAKKFICLNRKPHQHRVTLVEALLPFKADGYISLGTPTNPILLDEDFNVEQGIKDEFAALAANDAFVTDKIRNDIFSLGNLDIWRNSLLCLVTETEFSNPNPGDFFTSEKTFKPIIGLRPFFVYGQPALREYLKEQGFDIFEDIFNYNNINETAFDPEKMSQYTQVAVDAIQKISNPKQLYSDSLYARCVGNKIRFRSYVYDQWDKLHKLDLRDYV